MTRFAMASKVQRRFAPAVAVFIGAALLAGCEATDPTEGANNEQQAEDVDDASVGSEYQVPEEYQRMVLVGASQGGLLYNWAVYASELFNRELGMQTSVQAGATQANALEMEAGVIDFGMTSPIDLAQSADASVVDSPERTRTLWSSAMTGFHVLVAGDTGIESLSEFDGIRIAAGVTGSIESEILLTALDCSGVDPNDVAIQNIGKSEGGEAFADQSIDAWSGLGSYPTGAFLEAFESSRGANVIALEDDVVECVIDEYGYLTAGNIGAGTYPDQDGDAATVEQWFYATVAADVPAELVREMARVLHENHDSMVTAIPGVVDGTAENTAAFPGFPLHEGTQAYLTELGIDFAG